MRAMISAVEALEIVLRHASPREPVLVASIEATGLALARAVVADRDYPPFDRSVMDGFAARIAHAGRAVPIRGEARPGVPPSAAPTEDACVEIMTGASCPPGTEAVVMKEEVRREGATATMPELIERGQNIVPAGSECRMGTTVVPEGAVLTSIAQGLLATVGASSVWVRTRPRMALLVTGEEVVHGESQPGAVEIRDSNGPTLEAMARAAGFAAPTRRSVRDTPEAPARALDEAATADVVVLTGGVSAGNYDLVPAALAAHGATIVFHKVRQQPGKPILFATQGARLFFGLPGTPLGCHLGFHRYVLAAARALTGLPAPHGEEGALGAAWSTKGDRQQFLLARATRTKRSWELTLSSPKGSSDLFPAWAANAYVMIPEGTRELEAGARVTFEWLAEAT